MLALFENEVSRILVLPCLGISLAKKTVKILEIPFM